MSVRVMANVYLTKFPDLKDAAGNTSKASSAKAVTLALADHANDEGEGAYPSLETLAYKTALTRQAVIKTLDALKHNGVISAGGRSKWTTVNYSVNLTTLANGSKRDLQVNPVYPPSKPSLPPEVNPVYPNHQETTIKPNPPAAVSATVIEKANKTVDAIIANAANAKWKGRDLIRADLLEYADWYNATTGQVLSKRVQSSWYKALQAWKDEGLDLEDLQGAFDRARKWRMISDPNQLTQDAVAIRAARAIKPSPAQPARKFPKLVNGKLVEE